MTAQTYLTLGPVLEATLEMNRAGNATSNASAGLEIRWAWFLTRAT